MASNRIRKIVITGALGAISVILGVTRWGFIPWISGASLTVMHIPVIIGAVLEGPIVGTLIGLIFGAAACSRLLLTPSHRPTLGLSTRCCRSCHDYLLVQLHGWSILLSNAVESSV